MNDSNNTKANYIRLAGIIALIGNAVLAFVKLTLGIKASSLAVIGDGIDSTTDVLIAIVTLIVSVIVSRPCDREHPWGHQRAETTATMALSFIIIYAGLQLGISAVKKLISHSFNEAVSLTAIYAAVISIIGKLLLAVSQFSIGKKSNSDIIKANALNMRNDIIMSAGVLAGIGASKLFSLPVLDPVIALLVSAWVIKNGISLFLEQNFELMDGNADNSLYEKLFNAVGSVKGITNPHSARIRKMAGSFDIDLDIEAAPSMPLYEAHELSEQVEEAIRKAIPETYAVTIHIEPFDSCLHQREESFGLSPSSLNKNEENNN